MGMATKKILVFAAGGGGDIATASAYALKLRSLGYDTYISCAPWERVVVDPTPGPIKIGEVYNPSIVGDDFLGVDSNSYAMRGGRKIIFQAVNVSRVLGEVVYICDMDGGVEGLYRSLYNLSNYLGIDEIVALDVGGDILASGYEDDLWSPLADQITLSTIYKIEERTGLETLLALASPGADGELDRSYVLDRISMISRGGGYRGVFSFDVGDIDMLQEIFDGVVTEAGRIILDALNGFIGWKVIRGGTRKVYIDIISTLIFLLDTKVLYDYSSMAKAIRDTDSIEEANEILIKMGIPTELELEREVNRLIDGGSRVDGEILLRARRNLINRIKK
jgi:hypothetical protein